MPCGIMATDNFAGLCAQQELLRHWCPILKSRSCLLSIWHFMAGATNPKGVLVPGGLCFLRLVSSDALQDGRDDAPGTLNFEAARVSSAFKCFLLLL